MCWSAHAHTCASISRVVAALPELGEAIRAFEPVPGPAGESVAEWLAERALREPQEATVRVRLSYGKATGVYALCAAQIALSTEERAQLGGVHYRTQPAILLAQIRARRRLAGHRRGVARSMPTAPRDGALAYVGATVLVVDPVRRGRPTPVARTVRAFRTPSSLCPATAGCDDCGRNPQ